MILNCNNTLKITFYKISFQLNSKQSDKSKGKKCVFRWKFRLYFDFDTFLCLAGKNLPLTMEEGDFQALSCKLEI